MHHVSRACFTVHHGTYVRLSQNHGSLVLLDVHHTSDILSSLRYTSHVCCSLHHFFFFFSVLDIMALMALSCAYYSGVTSFAGSECCLDEHGLKAKFRYCIESLSNLSSLKSTFLQISCGCLHESGHKPFRLCSQTAYLRL